MFSQILFISRLFSRWRGITSLYISISTLFFTLCAFLLLQLLSEARAGSTSYAWTTVPLKLARVLAFHGPISLWLAAVHVISYVAAVVAYLVTAKWSRTYFQHSFAYWLSYGLAINVIIVTDIPLAGFLGYLAHTALVEPLAIRVVLLILILSVWIAKQLIDINVIARFNIANTNALSVSTIVRPEPLIGLIKLCSLGNLVIHIFPSAWRSLALAHSLLLLYKLVLSDFFVSLVSSIVSIGCLSSVFILVFLSNLLVREDDPPWKYLLLSIVSIVSGVSFSFYQYTRFYRAFERFSRSITFIRALEGGLFLGRRTGDFLHLICTLTRNANLRDRVPIHRFEASSVSPSVATRQFNERFGYALLLPPLHIFLYHWCIYYPTIYLLGLISLFGGRRLDRSRQYEKSAKAYRILPDYDIELFPRDTYPSGLLSVLAQHSPMLARLFELRTNGMDTVADRIYIKLLLKHAFDRIHDIELALVGYVYILAKASLQSRADLKVLHDMLVHTGCFQLARLDKIFVPDWTDSKERQYSVRMIEKMTALTFSYTIPHNRPSVTEFAQVIVHVCKGQTPLSPTHFLASAELTAYIDLSWHNLADPWIHLVMANIFESMFDHIVYREQEVTEKGTGSETILLVRRFQPAQHYLRYHFLPLFAHTDLKVFSIATLFAEMPRISILLSLFAPFVTWTSIEPRDMEPSTEKNLKPSARVINPLVTTATVKQTIPYMPMQFSRYEAGTLVTISTYNGQDPYVTPQYGTASDLGQWSHEYELLSASRYITNKQYLARSGEPYMWGSLPDTPNVIPSVSYDISPASLVTRLIYHYVRNSRMIQLECWDVTPADTLSGTRSQMAHGVSHRSSNTSTHRDSRSHSRGPLGSLEQNLLSLFENDHEVSPNLRAGSLGSQEGESSEHPLRGYSIAELGTNQALLEHRPAGQAVKAPLLVRVYGMSRALLSYPTLLALSDIVDVIWMMEPTTLDGSRVLDQEDQKTLEVLFLEHISYAFYLFIGFLGNLVPCWQDAQPHMCYDYTYPIGVGQILSIDNTLVMPALQLLHQEFDVIDSYFHRLISSPSKDHSVLVMYLSFLSRFNFLSRRTSTIYKMCRTLNINPEEYEPPVQEYTTLQEISKEASAELTKEQLESSLSLSHGESRARGAGGARCTSLSRRYLSSTTSAHSSSSRTTQGRRHPLSETHTAVIEQRRGQRTFDLDQEEHLSRHQFQDTDQAQESTHISLLDYPSEFRFKDDQRKAKLFMMGPTETQHIVFDDESSKETESSIQDFEEVYSRSESNLSQRFSRAFDTIYKHFQIPRIFRTAASRQGTIVYLVLSGLSTVMFLGMVYHLCYTFLGPEWVRGFVVIEFLDRHFRRLQYVLELWKENQEVRSQTKARKILLSQDLYLSQIFADLESLGLRSIHDGAGLQPADDATDSLGEPNSNTYFSDTYAVFTLKHIFNNVSDLNNILYIHSLSEGSGSAPVLSSGMRFLDIFFGFSSTVQEQWKYISELNRYTPFILLQAPFFDVSSCLLPPRALKLSFDDFLDASTYLITNRMRILQDNRYRIRLNEQGLPIAPYYHSFYQGTEKLIPRLTAYSLALSKVFSQYLFRFEGTVRAILYISCLAALLAVLRTLQFQTLVRTMHVLLSHYRKLTYADLVGLIRLSCHFAQDYISRYFDMAVSKLARTLYEEANQSISSTNAPIPPETLRGALLDMSAADSSDHLNSYYPSGRLDNSQVLPSPCSHSALTEGIPPPRYPRESILPSPSEDVGAIDIDTILFQAIEVGVPSRIHPFLFTRAWHERRLRRAQRYDQMRRLQEMLGVQRKYQAKAPSTRVVVNADDVCERLKQMNMLYRNAVPHVGCLQSWYIRSCFWGPLLSYPARQHALLYGISVRLEEYAFYKLERVIPPPELLNEIYRLQWRYQRLERWLDTISPWKLYMCLVALFILTVIMTIHVCGLSTFGLVLRTNGITAYTSLTRLVRMCQEMLDYLYDGLWNVRLAGSFEELQKRYDGSYQYILYGTFRNVLSDLRTTTIYSAPAAEYSHVFVDAANILHAFVFVIIRLFYFVVSVVKISLWPVIVLFSVRTASITAAEEGDNPSGHNLQYNERIINADFNRDAVSAFDMCAYYTGVANTILNLHTITQAKENNGAAVLLYNVTQDNLIYGNDINIDLDGTVLFTDPEADYLKAQNSPDVQKALVDMANRILQSALFRHYVDEFLNLTSHEFESVFISPDKELLPSNGKSVKRALQLLFVDDLRSHMLLEPPGLLTMGYGLADAYNIMVWVSGMIFACIFLPLFFFLGFYTIWGFHYHTYARGENSVLETRRVRRFSYLFKALGASLFGTCALLLLYVYITMMMTPSLLHDEFDTLKNAYLLSTQHYTYRTQLYRSLVLRTITYSDGTVLKGDDQQFLDEIFYPSLTALRYYGRSTPKKLQRLYFDSKELSRLSQENCGIYDCTIFESGMLETLPQTCFYMPKLHFSEFIRAEKSLYDHPFAFNTRHQLHGIQMVNDEAEEIIQAYYQYMEELSLTILIVWHMLGEAKIRYNATSTSGIPLGLSKEAWELHTDLRDVTFLMNRAFTRYHDSLGKLFTNIQHYHTTRYNFSTVLAILLSTVFMASLGFVTLISTNSIYLAYTQAVNGFCTPSQPDPKEVSTLQLGTHLEYCGRLIRNVHPQPRTRRDLQGIQKQYAPLFRRWPRQLSITGFRPFFSGEVLSYIVIPISIALLGLIFLGAAVGLLHVYARLYGLIFHSYNLSFLIDLLYHLIAVRLSEHADMTGKIQSVDFSYPYQDKFGLMEKLDALSKSARQTVFEYRFRQFFGAIRLTMEGLTYGTHYLLQYGSPYVRLNTSFSGALAETDLSFAQSETINPWHADFRTYFMANWPHAEIVLPTLLALHINEGTYQYVDSLLQYQTLVMTQGQAISVTYNQLERYFTALTSPPKSTDDAILILPRIRYLSLLTQNITQEIRESMQQTVGTTFGILFVIVLVWTVMVVILVWLTGRLQRLQRIAAFNQNVMVHFQQLLTPSQTRTRRLSLC
ncbi:hypothetical protein GMRT_13926 [Giardia muris]|uniref:Uncharacterized protein n=1 Tax=Giardia muris TaxID=5742 RepID=A0A4Z1SLS3_GIAMU|nr:hypothetical protein GMRT_13926 [Giardia muris]|eukprot:TNJ26490.1 hypothetical protein GMRT_13926 [Giardia muris]